MDGVVFLRSVQNLKRSPCVVHTCRDLATRLPIPRERALRR
jgi:hypothetical protein